jgi:lysozyme
VIAQAESHPEQLAWAGQIPQSQAFESVTTEGMAVPAERPVAMIMPENPTSGASRTGRAQIYSRQFRDAKPINFGKASPRKLAVHGVDVSRWQGEMDWAKLRTQGANFAYIKATDGGDHLDPMFKTNWRGPRMPAEARRLSLLLLVPHRRRTGRLVHPQRAA